MAVPFLLAFFVFFVRLGRTIVPGGLRGGREQGGESQDQGDEIRPGAKSGWEGVSNLRNFFNRKNMRGRVLVSNMIGHLTFW